MPAPSPDDGKTRRRREAPQERQRVEIGPTDQIRLQLRMSKETFSEAIGFHPSTYAGYLAKGYITQTGAMAAELLLRREQDTGNRPADLYLLRLHGAVPTIVTVVEMKTMILDGQEYFMIPK